MDLKRLKDVIQQKWQLDLVALTIQDLNLEPLVLSIPMLYQLGYESAVEEQRICLQFDPNPLTLDHLHIWDA